MARDSRLFGTTSSVGDSFESELATKPGPRSSIIRARILSETEAPPARKPESVALDDRNTTSIAVLPFEDLSGGGSQAHLADGLAEDLITELSRYRHLRVVSRHSSFAFRGQNRKIEDIAKSSTRSLSSKAAFASAASSFACRFSWPMVRPGNRSLLRGTIATSMTSWRFWTTSSRPLSPASHSISMLPLDHIDSMQQSTDWHIANFCMLEAFGKQGMRREREPS